jgi:hypothetical protein
MKARAAQALGIAVSTLYEPRRLRPQLDPSDGGADVQSILTHELGHFLGLGHAGRNAPDATMRANWDGIGTALRTLSADDEAAICELYPPDRIAATSSCTPRHGFGSECSAPLDQPASASCAVTVARTRESARIGGTLGVALLALATGRRRARRSAGCARARRGTPRTHRCSCCEWPNALAPRRSIVD